MQQNGTGEVYLLWEKTTRLEGDSNMNTRMMWAVGILTALTFSTAWAAEGEARDGKGEGKGPRGQARGNQIEALLKHAADLNLTAEQKTKIEALKQKFEKEREAIQQDPEAKELFKQIAEARKANDEAKLKELREKVREAIKKKIGEGGTEGPLAEIKAILTPEQLAKLKELIGANRGEHQGQGQGQKREKTPDNPADPKKADF